MVGGQVAHLCEQRSLLEPGTRHHISTFFSNHPVKQTSKVILGHVTRTPGQNACTYDPSSCAFTNTRFQRTMNHIRSDHFLEQTLCPDCQCWLPSSCPKDTLTPMVHKCLPSHRTNYWDQAPQ